MSKRFYIDGFKKTSEDWYSNFKIADDKRYEGKYVHVSYFPLGPKFDTYRVAVWGNDDTGMEFDTKSELDAQGIYLEVMHMDDVTRDKLINLGFGWA